MPRFTQSVVPSTENERGPLPPERMMEGKRMADGAPFPVQTATVPRLSRVCKRSNALGWIPSSLVTGFHDHYLNLRIKKDGFIATPTLLVGVTDSTSDTRPLSSGATRLHTPRNIVISSKII
jgi:hypothetical protein